MKKFSVQENGELEIIPTASSSKHDFDFYIGKWKIHNRKLNSRLSNCTEWTEFEAIQDMHLFLQGIGNIDRFMATLDNQPFEGMSLRLFNPQTKLWSIYWADSKTGVLQPPTIGSFDGTIGTFYAKDAFNGQEIIVKFLWDKSDEDEPVWSQAFSIDQGETWEWNWYMYMSRIG